MLRVSAPTVCVSWGDYIERPCLWCNGLLAEDHLILWLHAFQALKSLKVFLSDFVSRL